MYVDAVSIKLIAEPVRGESNPIHRKCQPFITTSGVIPILIATTIQAGCFTPLATHAGLEPATSSVTGSRANQLR